MKKSFISFMVICAALLAVSCSKTKSYTDMLKANDKAISRFIDDNKLKIIHEYPADSIFADNEFLELPSGVYMNVINKGSNERAVVGKTNVMVRFKVQGLIVPDTAMFSTLTSPSDALASFTYGDSQAYTPPFQQGSIEYVYVSLGVEEPLEYVGDGARVKLIVPFKKGSQSDISSGMPRYYSDLKYIFELQPDK